MIETDLSAFDNTWYKPGSKFKIALWFIVNHTFINSYLMPVSAIKRGLLKLFGAKIGKKVVIKPKVNIKYPWKLTIGDNTWIGEDVWIDNLDEVVIGENCCLSQGVSLICGNHDYSVSSFDLMIKPIKIQKGAWLGAFSKVSGGVVIASHSILSMGSICTKNTEEYMIYGGNPAVKLRDRSIKS